MPAAITGPQPASRVLLPVMALMGVVILVRGWLQFSSPYVPGINGAYYLVQARALLDHGVLAIPDLPLTFVLQAALASLIHLLTGWSQDDAILWAVKSADAVLPALVVLPVWALVTELMGAWRDRSGNVQPAAGLVPLAIAAALALGAPALGMVGDFQKNSLGLVWLAALPWFLHCWRSRASSAHALGAVAMLALGGLTHIGVFGSMLLLGGAFVLMHLVWRSAAGWRVLWPWLAAATVAGLAAALVVWGFDPHRVQRLVNAFLQPASLLQGGGPGGGPGGPGGGPPGAGLMGWLPCLLTCGLALATLVALWRRRAGSTVAQDGVVGACAVTVIALMGPWVSGDVTMRFGLIAMVPLTIVLAALVRQLPWRGSALAVTVFLGVMTLATAAPRVMHGGQPILSGTALQELHTMAARIEDPERTLVVARHGLEWWSSWMLGTHIAQPGAVRATDWLKYRQVLILHLKQGDTRGGPMDMMGPPGRPGAAPPGMPPPGSRDDRSAHPGDPFREMPIPAAATLVHEGTCFTLARVAQPVGATDR